MRSFAKAGLRRAVGTLEVISAVLLFVMMALTFVDVCRRYVFTAPVFGAAEMIQFLLAMTIFGGLSLVNARDDHIMVELFAPWLTRRFPRGHRIVVQAFSVAVMAIIARELASFALDAYRLGSITTVLEWPLVAVAGTVAALSVISLVVQVMALLLPDAAPGGPEHGEPL